MTGPKIDTHLQTTICRFVDIFHLLFFSRDQFFALYTSHALMKKNLHKYKRTRSALTWITVSLQYTVGALSTLDAFNSLPLLAEAVKRSAHIYARCRCISSLQHAHSVASVFFVFVIVGFLSIFPPLPVSAFFHFTFLMGKIFAVVAFFFHVSCCFFFGVLFELNRSLICAVGLQPFQCEKLFVPVWCVFWW